MITTASGLQYEDTTVGTGAEAQAGQHVSVHYTGWLYNDGVKGAKFDSSKDRNEAFEFDLGAGMVILIIFVFLRNIRSTVIICTSIPISIVGTFALLYFGGFTLNTLTFGGLALGVGMLVDAVPASREVALAVVWRLVARGQLRVDLSAPIARDTRITAAA